MSLRPPPLLLLALGLVGCGPPELEQVLTADPSREGGAPGTDGPWGAAWYLEKFRTDGGEGVKAEVFMPVDDVGAPAPGPLPAALVVQGGGVTVDRYRWLAAHIASHGYVTFVPVHPMRLAFFGQSRAVKVLDIAQRMADDLDEDEPLSHLDPDGHAVVVGHSLGGVMAARTWEMDVDDRIKDVVVFASYPYSRDDFAGRDGAGSRFFSITGTADGLLSPEKVLEGAQEFPGPTWVATVDGMNHFQFTDQPSERELSRDTAPTIDTAEGRRLAMYLLDLALRDRQGEDLSDLYDTAVWPEGLSPLLVPEEAP